MTDHADQIREAVKAEIQGHPGGLTNWRRVEPLLDSLLARLREAEQRAEKLRRALEMIEAEVGWVSGEEFSMRVALIVRAALSLPHPEGER